MASAKARAKPSRAFLWDRSALQQPCQQLRAGTAPLQVLLERTKTLRCSGDPKDKGEFSGQFQGPLCGSSFPSLFTAAQPQPQPQSHRIPHPCPKHSPAQVLAWQRAFPVPVPQLLHALLMLGPSRAPLRCSVGQGVLQKPQHS